MQIQTVQTKIERQSIQNLAKQNETSEGALMLLAMRERHRHETDVARFKLALLKQGIKVVDTDLTALFGKLQELGAGAYVHGRNGKADRFKWHYNLKDVAGLAFDNLKKPVPTRERKKEVKEKRKPGRPRKVQPIIASNRVFFIDLGKGRVMEVVTPEKFTNKEIETAFSAIKSQSS